LQKNAKARQGLLDIFLTQMFFTIAGVLFVVFSILMFNAYLQFLD